MRGTFKRGLGAGAAGVTALNTVTYIDMAWRGRPASRAPGEVVAAVLQRAGGAVPGRGEERDNRTRALGALAGTLTGMAVATLASFARDHGVRLSSPAGATLTAAAAMAAADVPLAVLGISDPREWSAKDWATDAAGHLAFGLAVHAALERSTPEQRKRASAGLICRSALLGAATGCRSTLSVAGPVLASRCANTPGSGVKRAGVGASLAAVAALGFELVADKLPTTPSRLEPPVLAERLMASMLGAVLLARREQANVGLPVIAAALGAAAASWTGVAWRRYTGNRGWALAGALAEDAVALSLAAVASVPRSAKTPALIAVRTAGDAQIRTTLIE